MDGRLRQWASAAACLSLATLPFGASAQDAQISSREALGPSIGATAVTPPALRNPLPGADLRSWVIHWNEVAINASGIDHTPVMEGENRVFGEQLGPTRASRALAIVQIAVFDSLVAISGGFRSYTGLSRVTGDVSAKAAVAQSSHDTLVALFPSQRASLDAELADSLQRVTDSAQARSAGIALGQRAATVILNLRGNDGSQHAEPLYGQGYIPSNQPGRWRQDPISRIDVVLGAFWGGVRPFVMTSSRQFRIPPPPALNSAAYTAAFDEVKRLGGDGVVTPTQRTEDQAFAGLYWAYDGTPSLCAPPRMYNQILVTLALQRNSDALQTARLLALANVAMADAGIASWESKFFYAFWRPITGVREADAGTGPTRAGDGNPATVGDVTFSPLGAPASNLNGPNFTPPFPSYPSGHATFGGTLFQTLRNFYGTDNIPFTFVSDEFNGVTRDNNGNVRPLRPRSFANLSAAEEENGQSRIYLGIHWAFDKTEGITQGQQIADYVFDRTFVPQAAGNGNVTVTPAVTNSTNFFNEQNVRIQNAGALTALSVTLVVRRTPGVSASGQFNTVGGGRITQSNTSTPSLITYQFTLASGQTLSASSNAVFAAQTQGSGTAHPTAGDSYTVSYTTGGQSFTQSGTF
jgi:hypothetical protein